MQQITYDFIIGLKDLSEKYKLDICLDIELSSTDFIINNYDTTFYVKTSAEEFSTMDILNLQKEVKGLLKRINYPNNLEYRFSISSKDGTLYSIIEDKYKPSKTNIGPLVINFSNNDIKKTSEQYYTLDFNAGKLILENDLQYSKNYFEKNEKYFKRNAEIIDFLNSFIDNKITKTTLPTTNEVVKDIRKIRGNINDYINDNLVNPLNFGFHYNNNGLTGIYSLFEYYVCKEDYYIDRLNKSKFISNLPAYALFRDVNMANFTKTPVEYTTTQPLTTSKVTNEKQYFEEVIKSLIQNTDIKLNNIKSIYINLDMLDYGFLYVEDDIFKITVNNKLLAQVEFMEFDKVLLSDFFRLKENIHKFLYETHGEGYSILTTKLEDDDSEFGGIQHDGYTLLEFIHDVRKPFYLINDKDKLNQYLKDAGIKPIKY